MPAEGLHHRSKKVRYDILLVPSDDARGTRRIRFAAWQVISVIIGSIALVVAFVLLLLMYTPLGPLVPIPNPELENKYARELRAVSERMVAVMQQLVELQTYNVKLRNALGQNIVQTDSGFVELRPPRGKNNRLSRPTEAQISSLSTNDNRSVKKVNWPVVEHVEQDGGQRVAFPAILPTEGYITRGFDPEQRHYGLDIAGKVGTPVTAAADGNVVFAGWTNEDGYLVILSHAGGFLSFYKHNQSLLKTANTFVKRGEPVALLGNSGLTSAGPHLHFEIWKDGSPVDPSLYVVNLNF